MLFGAPKMLFAISNELTGPRLIECTADLALPSKFLMWFRHFGKPLKTVKCEASHLFVVILCCCPIMAAGPNLLSIHRSIVVASALVSLT
jgi:hypothetical protein